MSAEWPIVTIDELKAENKGSIAIGPFGSRMKSDCYVASGIPVIRGTNITGGPTFDGNFVYITEEKADSLGSSNIYQDDLVFPHRGSIGEVGIVLKNERYVLSSSLMKLTCDKTKANPKFIYYFFKSRLGRHELLKNSSQVGTPGIGQPLTSLKGIELRLPPLEIQNHIDRILTTLDNKIQLNTQTNQTLEAIAQALFKSWFVDFNPVKAKITTLESGGSAEDAELAAMSIIAAKSPEQLAELKQSKPDSYDQLAQTAALFPSAMQESELGEIPDGWDVSSIEKSFKVIMGQSPKGDTYNEDGEGTLFYQGRAEFGWRFPSPRLYTTAPKRMANKGDVLMSVRAPVGDLNIALDDCCVGRGLCSLRHGSGSTTFTYYLLKQLQSKFNTFNGEGTVFGSINQKDLKSIQYISPDDKVIAAYRYLAEPLDHEIEILSVENSTLSSIRDSLLPKLLSGELLGD